MRARPWMLAAACLAAAVCVSLAMEARLPRRQPPLSELEPTPFAFRDAVLAVSGMRAAAADLAWVQLLQYMAGNLEGLPPDRPGRRYDHALALSRRIIRLDPSFRRGALYGAGVLGWFEDVDRADEAVELLAEGMRLAPDEPLFKLYLAALAYKGRGEDSRMIGLLERAFDDPQTPSTMRAILANTYERRGERGKALAAWRLILENPRDASEHARARRKLAELGRAAP